ncbi:hypothetical protein FA13DRAFT_646141 [Coprinellus micaceus]|uniref:Uncharacterized protein n=1 Tax=Coprinellus micaceus TaxID=71717 RepID=A0A4Y7T5P6_COPMI|nr:hypothetical protein FA13DRAFT_646141 [Coprinellus micaceus]
MVEPEVLVVWRDGLCIAVHGCARWHWCVVAHAPFTSPLPFLSSSPLLTAFCLLLFAMWSHSSLSSHSLHVGRERVVVVGESKSRDSRAASATLLDTKLRMVSCSMLLTCELQTPPL